MIPIKDPETDLDALRADLAEKYRALDQSYGVAAFGVEGRSPFADKAARLESGGRVVVAAWELPGHLRPSLTDTLNSGPHHYVLTADSLEPYEATESAG